MLRVVMIFGCVCAVTCSLEVTPFKVETSYNPKYIAFINVTMRKINRRSPYLLNFHVDWLCAWGNNFTIKVTLYEQISGRYILMPLAGQYKLCDFFVKEPYLGQMLLKQMPNWTCPGHAGPLVVNNITLQFPNFPFHIPFTWSDMNAKVRGDFLVVNTDTNELSYNFKMHFNVLQKPANNKPGKSIQ